MTLKDIISEIERIASAHPQIGEVIPDDIYALSTRKDARYGVFAWTQGQHTGDIYQDVTAWSFTLFYVDRLAAGQSNRLEVQSVGCQVLQNVARTLAQSMNVGAYTIRCFTQRFADDCAGAYMTLTVSAPNDSTCEQSFN